MSGIVLCVGEVLDKAGRGREKGGREFLEVKKEEVLGIVSEMYLCFVR